MTATRLAPLAHGSIERNCLRECLWEDQLTVEEKAWQNEEWWAL